METKKLFEITFIDGSQLWATTHIVNHIVKCNTICFGTFDKGINIIVKDEIFDKIDKTKICYFATEYTKTSKYVSSFIDFIELESSELQKQLLKAF